MRETADAWNDSIGTNCSCAAPARAELGIEGYYVRIAPPETAEAASPRCGFVPIKNRPWPHDNEPAYQIVSPDALALVRFGLRAADDPRIVNTVHAIDAVLKIETPHGPVWRRYNGDRYGEHADGSAFDGDGIGRGWPLLTGERAHYEIAAGRRGDAVRLLTAFEAFAGESGLIPEQVWDAADIRERELHIGGPSSGHASCVGAADPSTARSLRDGRTMTGRPGACSDT